MKMTTFNLLASDLLMAMSLGFPGDGSSPCPFYCKTPSQNIFIFQFLICFVFWIWVNCVVHFIVDMLTVATRHTHADMPTLQHTHSCGGESRLSVPVLTSLCKALSTWRNSWNKNILNIIILAWSFLSKITTGVKILNCGGLLVKHRTDNFPFSIQLFTCKTYFWKFILHLLGQGSTVMLCC